VLPSVSYVDVKAPYIKHEPVFIMNIQNYS